MRPAFKISFLFLGCLAVSLHVASVSAAATPVPPKGLRILFDGNSWFNFVPGGVADQVKGAGIEGHKEVRMTKPNDFSVLEAGEVDVYAHGVHWWMETPWSHGVTAEKLIEKGLKANPNFRAYYHAAWLVGDGRAKDIKTKNDYDSSKLSDVRTALDKTRKGVEATVDKLNEKFGKRVVFLVPVGDATLELREMVLEGKYPGVKKQSELWTDAMPHAGMHVMALSGYCHFTAIYRTSPVGLKISRWKELTDEQHAILQKLAWDMVSKYPYAGIAPQSDVKPKATFAKKDEPKTQDARPVPDQLKGWKATNAAPDEAIVKDYNDYIEKLPKAERPGVANVKYYVDGLGRHAVAVIVQADDTRWTHLLVYDKQHNRAGVTKFIDRSLADEVKSSVARNTPAGLRVAYTLMSNGAEMEAIVKAAGISGHKQANAPYFGTWHGYVGGGRDGIPKKAQELLAAGDIDALTVATWTWSPNRETWHKHVELDSALAGTVELGLKKNPNFRLCWRAFLKPHTVKKDKAVVPDFAQTKMTLEKETRELESHVDLVNQKLGKRVVLIVPHAQAGLSLVDLVAAGKFPGITDPAELWMKEEAFNMNVHRHLRALAAYCDFVAIYGISPEGLKPSFKGISYKSKGGPDHSMEGITDEQHAILQKIAWQTVSKYPYAGVGK